MYVCVCDICVFMFVCVCVGINGAVYHLSVVFTSLPFSLSRLNKLCSSWMAFAIQRQCGLFCVSSYLSIYLSACQFIWMSVCLDRCLDGSPAVLLADWLDEPMDGAMDFHIFARLVTSMSFFPHFIFPPLFFSRCLSQLPSLICPRALILRSFARFS